MESATAPIIAPVIVEDEIDDEEEGVAVGTLEVPGFIAFEEAGETFEEVETGGSESPTIPESSDEIKETN